MPKKPKYPPGVGRDFIVRHVWQHNAYMGQLFYAKRVLGNMATARSFTPDDRKEARELQIRVSALLDKARNRRDDSDFERKELK